MNRRLYEHLCLKSDTRASYWTCPTCSMGKLFIPTDNLRFNHTALSRCYRRDDDWDPRDAKFNFSVSLYCNEPSCKEQVHVVGYGEVEECLVQDDDGTTLSDYEQVFYPLYIVPPFTIFDVPSDTPVSVGDRLKDSFCVFFADVSSAANHLRSAVEMLLTELKIKKKRKTKNGKLQLLTLHARIELLHSKHGEIREMLFAVKWIGNAGSHATGLKRSDVLDGYEMMESCLVKLYENPKDNILNKARAINRKKGPVSRLRIRQRLTRLPKNS